MKLIECYIENFGKLHAYSHRFTDGLNVICEDNGFGKTTLTVFLKVMLYGFDETKKHSLAENDRKHYLPWSGGVCGGWLTFSVGEKCYKVERTFGTKASEDTYALYDLATGRASGAFPEGLGEGIFGIDSDGFERTVFLSERRFSVKNENKSVSAKLSDLVGFEWDVGALDDATDALDERRKFYYKRGGGGRIGELREEISICDGKIIAITRSTEELAACERELAEARASLTSLEKRRQEAARLSAHEGTLRHVRQRQRELEEKREELQEIKRRLGGTAPDETELYRAERAAERARFIEERLADSTRVKERNDEIKKELSLARGYLDRAERETERKKPIWIFLLAAILGAAGAALTAVLLVAGILLIISAAVALGVGAYVLSRRGASVDRGDEEQFISRYGYTTAATQEREKALGAIIAALEAEAAIVERQCTELYGLEEELKARRAEANAPIAHLEGLGEQPYLTLRRLVTRHSTIEEALARLERELADTLRASGIDPTELKEVRGEAQIIDTGALDEDIHTQRVRIATLETRCNAYRDRLTQLDELRDRRLELEEERARAEERLRLITLTKEHLLGAKDSLTTKYLGKTRDRFNRYLTLLCSESPDLFTLAVDFSITKSEVAKGRPEEAFSLGTRETYAIAARLALADSLYGEEAPPIILDDPFCHLDDTKCRAALDAIKSLARERQIIYLTCSESRIL